MPLCALIPQAAQCFTRLHAAQTYSLVGGHLIQLVVCVQAHRLVDALVRRLRMPWRIARPMVLVCVRSMSYCMWPKEPDVGLTQFLCGLRHNASSTAATLLAILSLTAAHRCVRVKRRQHFMQFAVAQIALVGCHRIHLR